MTLSALHVDDTRTGSAAERLPVRTALYVMVAAAAMVATLPGRTHGLGLITEPLLAELELGRVPFAALNLWATLLGAAACIPCGWLLDRIGIRIVLAAVLLGLGATVVAMARVSPSAEIMSMPAPQVFTGGSLSWIVVPAGLLLLVLLTRGLGQSALSVVSLALVGKASGENIGPVIGAYSFLVAVGFTGAFGLVKVAMEQGVGWRGLWEGMGWTLGVAGALVLILFRDPPAARADVAGRRPVAGYTLRQAALTPAFWVFGIATSFYGLVAAGLSLFNQSILAERRFDRSVYLTITTFSPLVGLAANLATGWLLARIPAGKLLAVALVLMAGALAAFPLVSTLAQVYAYAAVMGIAGGMVTVIFFAVWRQLYGAAHLGQIQGAAQLLTVVASALGPLILAAGQEAAGSYAPVLRQLAIVAAVLAAAAWFVPIPAPPATSTPEG